uniref:Reverse transcriptase domain-containing protein n=1 Tax=Oryza glaberrima TaxID=4538 RepID=I1Q2Y7_ORYGL
RAKEAGLLNGVIPHLVDDGVFILQYADDTIIFLEHDLQQEFRCILGSFLIKIGNLLKRELRKSLVVGKASIYLLVVDWC